MWRTGAQDWEVRDRTGEHGGGAKKRQKTLKHFTRDVEDGRDSGGGRKKRQQENVGSVDVDPGCLENKKEAESKVQSAQGLNKKYRENGLFVATDQLFS